MSKSRDLGEFPAAALDIDASGNVNLTGDVSLADNDKLILGDGSDLQIYHSGSTAVINNDVGHILIENTSDDKDIYIKSDDGAGGSATYIQVDGGAGSVNLRHYGLPKLATTATGIDVTGTVTADGLVVDGTATVSGNVGIGTISPSSYYMDDLVVLTSNEGGITVASDSVSSGAYLAFADGTVGDAAYRGFIHYGHGGDFMRFGTGAAEHVRIDDAGNVLVGKTTLNVGVVGHELRESGYSASTRDGSTVGSYTRLTSDGTILEFRKDSTTVGSIGSRAGVVTYISSGGSYTGLDFASAINPMKSGVLSDAVTDLGGSTNRFKDLYLSGKAYVGSILTADGNVSYNKISRNGGPVLYLQQVDSTNNIMQGHSASGTAGTGTLRITVAWNGNVQNSNNSYGGLSDQKLKENIADASSQWDDLKAVRLRNYSMISDEETSANRLGVIAQELEAAGMGGLVDESDDLDENEERLGTTTKSVKYSILYMKAVGALQEAQTRIESLETLTQSLITRIETLEAK